MRPAAHLDHLVVAARTLEEGQSWLEGRLGVPLAPGGNHDPFGTHNLLLSLGPDAYLEVIAVNPAAPPPGRPRWFGLDTAGVQARLEAGPVLLHWVAQHGVAAGWPEAGEALALSRGDNRWTLSVPPDGSLPYTARGWAGVAPSLISWQTPSPPTRLPDVGVRLSQLRLWTPDPDGLRGLLDELGLVGEIEVREVPENRLEAVLDTPRGPVTL